MPKYKRTPEAMAKELRRDWDDNEARYEHAQKVIIERARRYLYSVLRRHEWIFVTGSKLATRIQTNLTKAEYDDLLEITLFAQHVCDKQPWNMFILNPNVLHSENFRGWDYRAELFCQTDGIGIEKSTRYFITMTEDNEKIKEFLGYIPEETKNAKV
jgi:hypothetical protein